jgi:hypothetical protein
MGKGKYEIIEELALNKTIEEIIHNIAQTKDDTLNDLAQMLYEDLLMKDEEKIVQLYESEQLQYFITRMVLNSINSKTSRYYYAFKKYNNNAQELEYEGENAEY